MKFLEKLIKFFKLWLGEKIHVLEHEYEVEAKERLRKYVQTYGGRVYLYGTKYAPLNEGFKDYLTKEEAITFLKEAGREDEIDSLRETYPHENWFGSGTGVPNKTFKDGSHDNKIFLEMLLNGEETERLGRVKGLARIGKTKVLKIKKNKKK